MKIKVIINPKSKKGNARYIKMMLIEKFAHFLVDMEQTSHPQHATEIARQSLFEKFDTIIAVGGDGTVNEVLNGIAGTNVALGIIPAGTANDLASFYHIPANICKACEVIQARHLQSVDVISVNGKKYITSGGIGLPSEVISVTNLLKHYGAIGKLLKQVLGSKLYILAILCNLVKKIRRRNLLKIRSNGYSLMADSLSLMVSNQPFLGKYLQMSPEAVNNDGRFDICLIDNLKRRIEILKILIKLIEGKHIYSNSVKTWSSEELLVSTEIPMKFFGDGEFLENASEFRVKIFPRALNLIVPRKISGR